VGSHCGAIIFSDEFKVFYPWRISFIPTDESVILARKSEIDAAALSTPWIHYVWNMRLLPYILALLISTSAGAQSEEMTLDWLRTNYKLCTNHHIPLGNGFFKSSYMRIKEGAINTIRIYQAGYYKSPVTSEISQEWTDMMELNIIDLMWQRSGTYKSEEMVPNGGGTGRDFRIVIKPHAKYKFCSKRAYAAVFGGNDDYDLRTAGVDAHLRFSYDGEENGKQLYVYLRALMYMSKITGGLEHTEEF
jgi:hypothetical protein